ADIGADVNEGHPSREAAADEATDVGFPLLVMADNRRQVRVAGVEEHGAEIRLDLHRVLRQQNGVLERPRPNRVVLGVGGGYGRRSTCGYRTDRLDQRAIDFTSADHIWT